MEKLQVPGWRIEHRFNNKCLIGNWNEERRKFERGNKPFGNSSHRADYKNYDNFDPDTQSRRSASMNNEGMNKKFIFSHHGTCYSNNMISWYDQHMNQRGVREQTLPKLRTWDGKYTSWVPEKTDHPLQGRSTCFGLGAIKREKWRNEELANNKPGQSTYCNSFQPHPNSAMVFEHHATRKPLSSHFHSHSINKHLALRNTNVNLAPEYPLQ